MLLLLKDLEKIDVTYVHTHTHTTDEGNNNFEIVSSFILRRLLYATFLKPHSLGR